MNPVMAVPAERLMQVKVAMAATAALPKAAVSTIPL
jgi:hypothetical protein